MHARSYPVVHRFLKVEEPQLMSPNEPMPPRKNFDEEEWLQLQTITASDPNLMGFVQEFKHCPPKGASDYRNTRAFLEVLFPTKYWTENEIRFKQRVSMQEPTRQEVDSMNEKLDSELVIRQSQASANYCPIRLDLHMELFDELIRQVTIQCPLQGFLLSRVRGELNQTLEAYRLTLDASLAEEGKVRIDQSDAEVMMLTKKLNEAEAELKIAEEEHSNLVSDYREVLGRYDLFERIKTQLHEPAVTFAKSVGQAIERQLYHFENPPAFEDEEPDPMRELL